MVLGLLVARGVVRRISAVVTKLILLISGYVGVLKVAVVFLLVGRSGVLSVGEDGGDDSAQQQYLIIHPRY